MYLLTIGFKAFVDHVCHEEGYPLSLTNLLAGQGPAPQKSSRPVFPPEPPPGVYNGEFLPDSAFSQGLLVEYCRQLLLKETKPLITLWAYQNKEDERELTLPVYPTPVNYVLWRNQYESLKSRKWSAIAQFLATGGGGLLSIRDASGRTNVIEVGRTSVADLLSKQGNSRVLSWNALAHPTNPPTTSVVFLIRTQESLSPEIGLHMLAELQSLPFDDVWLVIRNYSWFIECNEFPFIHPYLEGAASPPSHEDYWNSSTMNCLKWRSMPPSCTVAEHSGNQPQPK